MAWPEVAERAADSLLVVPVGSTEQHGPHLPLSTDTDVALEMAARLAMARADVVVAPPLAYGSSGEHAAFAGTLSIGRDALELVLVELGRSADVFAGVLFLSGHGGNAEPLGRAAARLGREGRRVRVWGPRGATGDGNFDAHAGRIETSVVLALEPAAVRSGAARAGNTAAVADLLPALRSGGVAAVSPNGVLGDPAGATPDEGRRLLEAWTADLVDSLTGWP
jgi:creatinine amidohydrolase